MTTLRTPRVVPSLHSKNPFTIHCVPALEDNYFFVLADPVSHEAAVVDPTEPEAVLRYLKEHSLRCTHILNTHHHYDHVGGNTALLAQFPEARVVCGEKDRDRIPGAQVLCADGDTLLLPSAANPTSPWMARVLFVPGHTRGHVAYFFPTAEEPGQDGELFIGDTLFGGGCGKVCDGTHEDLFASLQRLRTLGDATRVWCAHEYTLKNLQVAAQIEPHNPQLAERLEEVARMRAAGQTTVPLTLGVEKRTNPFLRWDDPGLQAATRTPGAFATFRWVRDFRDQF